MNIRAAAIAIENPPFVLFGDMLLLVVEINTPLSELMLKVVWVSVCTVGSVVLVVVVLVVVVDDLEVVELVGAEPAVSMTKR